MTGPRRVIRERRVARMSPLFVARGAAVNLRGLVLVMPVVSVGNVGQLSVDLIISTLGLPRVGYIHSDGLVPVVGNDPYATTSENSSEMCTSCEVYASADRKLAVLQIRSPIVQGKQRSFRQQILSWIKENEFSRVVVLSSSFAHHRVDQQLVGTPLRYLATPALQNIMENEFQILKWKEMEKVAAFPGISEVEQELSIPGGGITKSLYTDSCAEGIPLAVLLIFCSEGDNIPDALKLLNFLNEWIQLIAKPNDQQPMSQPQWKIPSSWRLLFGSGIPPALF
ncbi:proteasome assembly chaperone 2 isoform X1 [Amblyraja radiata]|uniref:proteasome assembly chaperone 2 isoform X1 n=1 Tax=Amblyraja radiata TaxID=386614 RepID=UPI0014030DF9|nr:proteasome assembly chaperone 2 isoform X1 [Amblyraja radiata]